MTSPVVAAFEQYSNARQQIEAHNDGHINGLQAYTVAVRDLYTEAAVESFKGTDEEKTAFRALVDYQITNAALGRMLQLLREW